MATYGIMAGRRISGSRIPPLRVVACADTQSLKGPAVARPIRAPARIAKFVKPVLFRIETLAAVINWLLIL